MTAVGCSGGASSSGDDLASSTVPPPPEIPTYVDPAIPISSPIGREFSIMLPADPGAGWRWVLTPIDNTRLIALGSRFSDDPNLMAKVDSATPTTIAAPTTTRFGTASTSSTSTTVAPAVLPLVQIISFAGRSLGPATLTFQYTQIAGEPQAQNRVLTFSVEIISPPPTTTTTTTSTSSTTVP
jgi:hypothetical protein